MFILKRDQPHHAPPIAQGTAPLMPTPTTETPLQNIEKNTMIQLTFPRGAPARPGPFRHSPSPVDWT